MLTAKGSVPVGGRASFVLPVGPHTNGGTVAVTEGAAGAVVFEGGKFVPGAAAGIAAASMNEEDRHLYIETGSGAYDFSVLAQASSQLA